uniref:DALR anticodon-binding domain-containing protein n=1 Tax=Streptomyces mesophilus TaxID=1775132 RepID=UPI0022A8B225
HRPAARQAPARSHPCDGRRRGPHARVHRDRARGPGARLALAEAAGTVLAGGLSLLGIDAPEHL